MTSWYSGFESNRCIHTLGYVPTHCRSFLLLLWTYRRIRLRRDLKKNRSHYQSQFIWWPEHGSLKFQGSERLLSGRRQGQYFLFWSTNNPSGTVGYISTRCMLYSIYPNMGQVKTQNALRIEEGPRWGTLSNLQGLAFVASKLYCTNCSTAALMLCSSFLIAGGQHQFAMANDIAHMGKSSSFITWLVTLYWPLRYPLSDRSVFSLYRSLRYAPLSYWSLCL